ncbi:MAG: ROK family protein [Myxococcota bacterium]
MASLLLGIDIGGTKVAFALGESDGRVRARWRRPTEPSPRPEADLARMVADAKRLISESGCSLAQVQAVGVTVPGPMDAEGGRVLHPPNLPSWKEVAVSEPLAQAFGVPVALENDANAAALAEWRWGAGRGLQHLVYLTMSTGVGAGLVLGGRIHRGRRDSAGEIGHSPVEWKGEPCACGLRGCLEAYVGGAAWTRRLRATTPDNSRVLLLAGRRDHVTPEHVVIAAREGDSFALGELERFNHYLARALVQIAFTLAPQAVILGTIAVAAGESLCFAPLREQVRAHTWPRVGEGLQILPAALGEDLPYLAALCTAESALQAHCATSGGGQ